MKVAKDPATIERDRVYRENMKKSGFKRVHVFVHSDDVPKVRNYARKLRDKKTASLNSKR